MTSLRSLVGFLLLVLLANSAWAQEEQPEAVKAGTIRGRVVNDRGQPLFDAGVTLRAYGATVPPRQTLTDREGSFQFTGLPAAVYLLSPYYPAHAPAPRDPDSTQGNTYRIGDNVTLVMLKGGVITGKVTNPSGGPVVRMRVRARMIRDGNGQQIRYGSVANEMDTDDRGVYRIYGLSTGTYVVSAGGRNRNNNDAPTYAPSATVDTASEISVQAGQETTNIDISYRGETGHAITGSVSGPQGLDIQSTSVTLTFRREDGSQWNETSQGGPGFSFLGVADGDYDLTAQSHFVNGERAVSAPARVKVRGADVTGLELATKQLGSISGRVILENSNAPECKGKRRAIVTETLVAAWHNQKESKDQPQFVWSLGTPAIPTEQGELSLRNLAAGQYQVVARLFAKYWYLRSITLTASGLPAQQANRTIDVVSNWATLKPGDRLSGLTVTLAEGAASLQGQVKVGEGETLPGRLYVYLVPVERDKDQDALKFFASPVAADRTIALHHVAPGRYWIVAQPALEGPTTPLTRLRLPDEKETRARLRRDAELTKIEIELKPCQNVTGYELPLRAAGSGR